MISEKINLLSVFVFSIILFYCTGCTNDHSMGLGNYYDFYRVPITTKLAENLRDCKSCRFYSTEPLVCYKCSPGTKHILSFKKGAGETCIIKKETGHIFSATSKKDFEIRIPKPLAQRVGEIFLLAFDYTPENQQTIRSFVSCINGYDTSDIYTDPKEYLYQAINSLEEKLDDYDVKNIESIENSPKQSLIKEKNLCKKTEKNIAKFIKNTPDFDKLSNRQVADLIFQAAPKLEELSNYKGTNSSGGKDSKNNRFFYEWDTGISKCEIKFNSSGIISSSFVEGSMSQEDLPFLHVPRKCW